MPGTCHLTAKRQKFFFFWTGLIKVPKDKTKTIVDLPPIDAQEEPTATGLALDASGDVLVFGDFTKVNGASTAYVARLHGGEWPTVLPSSMRRLASGEFQFQATSAMNQALVIEVAANLTRPNWTSIATNIFTGGALFFTDTDAGKISMRFYRAIAR